MKSFNDRLEHLRKHDSKMLRNVLAYGFDSSHVPDIKTIPEYKPDDSPLTMSYNNFWTMHSQLFRFFNGAMDEKRRIRKLRGYLETMTEQEAKLLEEIVLQKVSRKYLTEFLVRKAFPNLLAENKNDKR